MITSFKTSNSIESVIIKCIFKIKLWQTTVVIAFIQNLQTTHNDSTIKKNSG